MSVSKSSRPSDTRAELVELVRRRAEISVRFCFVFFFLIYFVLKVFKKFISILLLIYSSYIDSMDSIDSIDSMVSEMIVVMI